MIAPPWEAWCSRRPGDLRQDNSRRIWYSDAYRQAREQPSELPLRRCSRLAANPDIQRKLYGERAVRSVL